MNWLMNVFRLWRFRKAMEVDKEAITQKVIRKELAEGKAEWEKEWGAYDVYVKSAKSKMQWTCSCGTTRTGARWCLKCGDEWPMGYDDTMFEQALQMAEAANDAKAIEQGRERLRRNKMWKDAAKRLKEDTPNDVL